MRSSSRRVVSALAASLVLVLVTGTMAAGKPDGQKKDKKKKGTPPVAAPLAPMDYIAQADKLSQPSYPDVVKESFRIDAHDGETLYIEVTRPNPATYGEMQLPVILEASPYHGTIASRTGDRVFPGPRDANGKLLGMTGYFAPRGYAVVMMDLRGTGKSTGCLDHLGPNDAKDLKTTVEWAASRTWSNGRVGMTGHSYVGSTPSVAAAMRPEGLATIVPSAGLASMYDHQFQMGVPYNFQWAGPVYAYELLALSRDLPPGSYPSTVPPAGDNWDGTPNPQTGCGMQNSAATAGPGEVTGQYELWHAKRDWRELAADADIPTFMVHGVNDNAARIPAAEWFFANRYNRPGDKVWLGQHDHGSAGLTRCKQGIGLPTGHMNCRFDQWTYALHAWFDHHLMQRTWTDAEGLVHPIDTGPAVEAFLNPQTPLPVQTNGNYDAVANPGKVYVSDGWSRPAVRRELFLDATDMSVGFDEPAATGSAAFTGQVNLLQQGSVSANAFPSSLTFVGEPVAQDTLFLGLPRMNLNASVTNEVSHLTVQLFRENEAGVREAINTCAIQPQLRHGIYTIAPVVPGQEMDLPMQCFTMAHWIPAGQHLEVVVSTRTAHHASFGSAGPVTVFTGPDRSNFLLPEVPNATLHEDVPLFQAAA